MPCTAQLYMNPRMWNEMNYKMKCVNTRSKYRNRPNDAITNANEISFISSFLLFVFVYCPYLISVKNEMRHAKHTDAFTGSEVNLWNCKYWRVPNDTIASLCTPRSPIRTVDCCAHTTSNAKTPINENKLWNLSNVRGQSRTEREREKREQKNKTHLLICANVYKREIPYKNYCWTFSSAFDLN